tara:strand:+ start:10397 stop:10843 length:447 start_codon:yes stop_codon:yes gene_type:complete
MLKPYDNQMRIPSDELEEMYYNDEQIATPLKMLIGNCTEQKEYWIDRNRIDEDVIVDFTFNGNVSFFTKWQMKRKLLRQIKTASKKQYRIICSGNHLTKRQRSSILKALPNYRKCAIVWENNLKSMVEDGYERPSLTEGFEDFTYIVS